MTAKKSPVASVSLDPKSEQFGVLSLIAKKGGSMFEDKIIEEAGHDNVKTELFRGFEG